MMRAWVALLALATPVLLGGGAPDDRGRLLAAKRAAAQAQARADQLTAQAAGERVAADRAAADERALRARVQAAAAGVREAELRVLLVERRLAAEQAALARTQAPAAGLLAGLQSLARRPAIAAVAQPGSVDDLVHLRAVLGATLPVVKVRAQAVRGRLAVTRRLRRGAALATEALRQGRARLETERAALAAAETRHRAQALALGRDAIGEGDRALALGERARDLVDRLAAAGAAKATAGELAALPGPLPRPLKSPDSAVSERPANVYRLPIAGEVVAGLGELSAAGVRSRGITLAVAPRAVAVAPTAGTVRFAGRFRSFGTIVILDHGAGWTTLVTGLASTPLRRGAAVAAGAPIGRAGADEPQVTVELRRRGRPMDLLALAG